MIRDNKNKLNRLKIHKLTFWFLHSIIILIVLIFNFACKSENKSEHWYPVTGDLSEGWISVNPTTGVAGRLGTWIVTYKAGSSGIATGGGILVQLPDTWHAGDRNSANPLQSTDPQKMHYISSNCSNPGVQLKIKVENQKDRELIKHPKVGLDNRFERYVFVVSVKVAQGRLNEGDIIHVLYGDTSRGSPGMFASIVRTEPEPILSAVDVDGDGLFIPTPDGQKQSLRRPMIQSLSGPPAELLINGPSTLVVDQPAQLHIALVDQFANPVMSFDERLKLKSLGLHVKLPQGQKILSEGGWTGGGWTNVEFTPLEPGILTIRVDTENLSATSNPMIVHTEEPKYSLYWGDIHSHSKYSWDGVGAGAFDYARYISGLDFYALTDHGIKPDVDSLPRGLWHHTWDEYNALTEKYHDTEKFVTLHAYECSMGKPYGHHNIYFRNRPGTILKNKNTSLKELWHDLEPGQALTIPHHTGKFPIGIEWKPDDPRFRRNIEIYSGHGLSESYNPHHHLSFENSEFTSKSKSAPQSQSVQGAWSAGLYLSTIASSDEHLSHPGQPHYGITAVLAPELTREAIFDGLYQRRTYGTTGVRIYLDFKINGVGMGSEIVLHEFPKISVHAIGTNKIAQLELLKSEEGSDFRVIKKWLPEEIDCKLDYIDTQNHGDAIYYVRLTQQGEVRGLPAMAWSSPIWIKK
jgi:hypothetical protein